MEASTHSYCSVRILHITDYPASSSTEPRMYVGNASIYILCSITRRCGCMMASDFETSLLFCKPHRVYSRSPPIKHEVPTNDT